jgi:Galactose oxidase, central domain
VEAGVSSGRALGLNLRATISAIVSTCLIAILIGVSRANAQKTYQFAPAAPRQPTGDLVDSRFAATATVLPNGQVLIAGGVASENSYTASAELYDPNTGAFMRTGSLSSGRAYHTATLLKDGRVLIAGGIGVDGQPVASAEIYDPSSGKFSVTGTMLQARYNLAATLLPNGKVLMTGGDITALMTTNTATAELYDPATGSFTGGGNVTRFYDPSTDKFYYKGKMLAVHGKHTATLLQDGNVLIAGGGDAIGTAQAAAEVYDSASGKFVPAGPMNFARQQHRATLLANGSVLITGGVDDHGQVLATAELFNPATRKFTLTTAAFPANGTNMSQSRYEHTAALLPNGQVLIAGGGGGNGTSNTAELYDPSRGTFTCIGGKNSIGTQCAGSMNDYRSDAMETLLPNSEVLIAGGYNFHLGTAHNLAAAQEITGGASVPFNVLWTAEVYNPTAGRFVSTVSIAQAHFGAPTH